MGGIPPQRYRCLLPAVHRSHRLPLGTLPRCLRNFHAASGRGDLRDGLHRRRDAGVSPAPVPRTSGRPMIGTARVHRSRRPPSPPRSPTPARQPVIAAARGSSRYTVQCDAADPDPDGAVSGGRAAGPPDAIPAGEYAPADRGRARCLPNVRRLGSRRRFQDLADVATKTSPTSLPRPRRRRYQEPAGVATRTSPASLPGPRRRRYQDLAGVTTRTSPTSLPRPRRRGRG